MPRFASASLLLCLLSLALGGCGSRPEPAAGAKIRTLAFASVSLAGAADLPPAVAEDLEDALRRAFSSRGYAVVPGPGADGQIRASWFTEQSSAVGLSVSVFDAKGERIFSARSARPIPARQWNPAKVVAEADQLLRSMPPAPAP